MLKGFKDFILRGNVIDLAVGVAIAGAFTALITAFTNYIINPLIAAAGGGKSIGLGIQLVGENKGTANAAKTFMDFGGLITAALTFLITAAVIYFVLVVPMNKFMERRKRGQVEEVVEDEMSVLTEIRDLLKTRA